MGLKERFWSKVEKTEGCWLWNSKGSSYGVFTIQGKDQILAHRLSWILNNGPIPKGLWVLHSCDNPLCVNPSHLWLGNAQDNARDRESKGRGAHHKHGKLNHEIAQEIRLRYQREKVTKRKLANEYGVRPSQIGRLIAGKSWSP